MLIILGSGGKVNKVSGLLDMAWHGEGTSNYVPRLSTQDHNENFTKFSSFYIEDGSYLKLKNLSIGYTWRPKFKGISSINIYGNATNLFTITGYSWFDPEVNAFGSDTSRRGVDIYSYPSSRTFSLGLKVDF